MDAREFWQEVKDQKGELAANQKAGKLQPSEADGALIYVISIRNKERNSEAGVVSLATHHLAAQCLIRHTHLVATDEQIKVHKKHQEDQYEYHKAQEIKKRAQFVVQVGDTTADLGARPKK